MSKREQETKQESATGSLDKFLPDGEFGPVTNREEYEQRLNTLPPEQRQFAEESTRFADIWQYFSEHGMQMPKEVVNQVSELPKLTTAEQTTVLHRVNQELMEYLNDVGEDSGVRQ
jgi:diadenosine tetraphosphate (Ap4A) HIT family hydrolase